MGRAAAFVAAYALALNVILSSLLIAGVSPAAAVAGQILCINGADAGAAHSDADKNGRAGPIHCPLCVGHHLTGALPPPELTLAGRLPVSIATVQAFEARFIARFRSHDHQSRGPPELS